MAVGENEKLESLKLESRKLESFCLSLKEPSEIGKNRLSNFSGWSPARAFQFQLELSNFAANFSTSARTFQLRSFQCHFGLSNFSFFPTALPNYTYPIRALSMSLTHVGDSLCWCYVLHVGHRFSHLKSHQFCHQKVLCKQLLYQLLFLILGHIAVRRYLFVEHFRIQVLILTTFKVFLARWDFAVTNHHVVNYFLRHYGP